MSIRGSKAAVAAVILTALLAGPAQGQTLTQRVQELFTFGDCGGSLCLQVDGGHGDHYIPEVVQGEQNTLAFLQAAIGAGLTSIPAAAANGGVRVRFVDGRPVTEEISPGPIFAERAQTLGRGILLAGGNVTGLSFSNIRGVPLSDLELNFGHVNVGNASFGDPDFENDIIRVRTALDVSLLVANVYLAYGVSDAVDLGVAVPLVQTSLGGSSQADVISTLSQTPHQFVGGGTSAQTATDGSAVGVGDISVRAKVRLYEQDTWGAAVLGEARLPTGSEEDFHGTGGVGVRALGILSGQAGNFSPHLNGGVLLSGSEAQGDQLLLTAGFDQILAPNVTLALDFLGAWGLGESTVVLPDDLRFDVPQPRTTRSSNLPDIADTRMDGSVGLKFLAGGARIVANALVPLNDGGMRPAVVWTLGLERLF